jgi:hypothetical protein
VQASAPSDFDKAYITLLDLRAGGLVIGPDNSSSVSAISSLRWRRAI